MSKKVWYNWPAGYWQGLIPLHQIIRRFLFIPFVLLSFGLFCLFVYAGWGRSDAEEMFERVW